MRIAGIWYEKTTLPLDKEGSMLLVEIAPAPCLEGNIEQVHRELIECHEELSKHGYSNIRLVSEEVAPDDPHADLDCYIFVKLTAERRMTSEEEGKWAKWRKKWFSQEE